MSLSTGDIFEGVYQLEERVSSGEYGQPSRWLADDITSYRRSEVLIDTIPADYVAELHWKSDIPGIKAAGQSEDSHCRYIVWQKEQAPPSMVKCELTDLNSTARKHLADLIDAIPVAANEALLASTFPECWQSDAHGVMIFYQKTVAAELAQLLTHQVKEDWKQTLFATPRIESQNAVHADPARPSALFWPVILSIIGLVLAAGVYSLRSQPGANTVDSQSTNRLKVFTDAFERGIVYVDKAAYQEAVQSFETAVREAPASEVIDARLDSLARIYTAYAQAECARYQSTGSTQLYFIPNQYYHYAAILSRRPTIDTCD